MKLNLNAKNSSPNQIHFFFKKESAKDFNFCSPLPKEIKQSLSQILRAEGLKTDFGQTFFFRNHNKGHHLCISLGKNEKPGPGKTREIFGRIYKRLQLEKVFDFSVSLDSFPCPEKVQAFKAMVESLIMSDYHFDKFKKNEKNKPDVKVFFQSKKEGTDLKKHLVESEIIAKGVNFCPLPWRLSR